MTKIKKVYDDLRETITELDILESRIDSIMNNSGHPDIDHVSELEREQKEFIKAVNNLNIAIDKFLEEKRETKTIIRLHQRAEKSGTDKVSEILKKLLLLSSKNLKKKIKSSPKSEWANILDEWLEEEEGKDEN